MQETRKTKHNNSRVLGVLDLKEMMSLCYVAKSIAPQCKMFSKHYRDFAKVKVEPNTDRFMQLLQGELHQIVDFINT